MAWVGFGFCVRLGHAPVPLGTLLKKKSVKKKRVKTIISVRY